MILKTSINNAISKLKESKQAYDWILRNRNEVDEKSDEYHRNFSTMQKAFSAADIMLRCILIEHNIPIWKKKGSHYEEKYFSADDDEVKLCAREAACAIAYYNSMHSECQILSDVDFSCLIGVNKETRNLDEHLGKKGILQDMYRVFINLNKILFALKNYGCDMEIRPDRWEEKFDFPRFYSCVHSFSTDERRYILVADSMHNVPQEHLAIFLSLPWSIILDFDAISAYGGVKEILNKHAETIKHNEYLYSSFGVNNTITFINDRMAYIPICEEDYLRSNIVPKKEDISQDAVNSKQISMKIRDTLHPYASIIVTGYMTERMRDVCKIIKNEFKNVEMIYLSAQNIQNPFLLKRMEEDEFEESGNIIETYFFENSIFSVMESIYSNRKLLPQGKTVQFNEDEGYVFPLPTKERIHLQDTMQIARLEKSFEFVHLNIGKEKHEINKNDFFHGNIATWRTIETGNVPYLADVTNFQTSIFHEESNRCYYLYHLPGFGGTTLGRLICWELHNILPAVWIRHMDSEAAIIRDLRDISNLLRNHPFVLFVDENDFSKVDMQKIEKIVECSDFRFWGVFIYRVSVNEAEAKQRKKKENELVLSLMETKYKEKLFSECMELLKAQGQETFYDQRKKSMDATLEEKEKCALLINLYLLEKDFKLDTYVRGFLHNIPQDSDGEKIRNILAFTAMGAYFSDLKIPISYYSQYMELNHGSYPVAGGRRKLIIEKFFQPYEGLLLYVEHHGIRMCGIKHFLIAKEMLLQLLSTNGGENWRGRLDVVVCNLMDMLQELLHGMSQIDDVAENIITCLFTDKTQSRYIDEGIDDYSSNFTSLFNAMNSSQRLKVIGYVSDKLERFIFRKIPKGKGRREYKILAHVYAVRARIVSKICSEDIFTDISNEKDCEEKLRKYISETIELIESEELYEYDLEHMLGMCHLECAERMLETLDQMDESGLKKLFASVDKAIHHFDRTIWYGSPDYGLSSKLRSINCGLRAIKTYYAIQDKDVVIKFNDIDKAKEYRLQGINSIRNIPEYDLSIKGRVFAERQRDKFDEICSPGNPSQILERLENLRNNLEDDDYEGQYMISTQMVYEYEKKYKTVNMTGTGALIRKAFRGDQGAQKDAKKIFSHLERIVQMENVHPVSYTTYNLWFEYAKYMQIPLSKARIIALEWKNRESNRLNTNKLNERIRVRPYYYLFVITLLLYMEQQSVTAQDVVNRRTELDTVRDRNYKGGIVQDWYTGNRKGMGHLYSREWIDVGAVDDESDISEVRGKVVYLDEKISGYLHITKPQRLSSWTKPPKGKAYNEDCDVYFRLKVSNVISKEDVGSNIEKKFKFGFSYDHAFASQKSLENRNVKKSKILDGDRQTIF